MIYLVTSGEYSSYRVDAAFAREEDAKRVAESVGGEVEPFDLIFDAGEPAEVLELSMRQAGWNGRIIDESERRWDQWPHSDNRTGEIEVIRQPEAILPSAFYDPERWIGWMGVRGTDHDRVRKVYGEQKASVLAELDLLGIEWEWPTPEPDWVKAERESMSMSTSDLVVTDVGERDDG